MANMERVVRKSQDRKENNENEFLHGEIEEEKEELREEIKREKENVWQMRKLDVMVEEKK